MINDIFIFLNLDPSKFVESRYSSSLSKTSQIYCRAINCSQSMFYYESIDLNISIEGLYSIQCNSSMDTYGYIYNNTFNSSFPTENLINQNDDGGGYRQFLFSMYFNSLTKYILIVTTYLEDTTGPFSILVAGPTFLDFNRQ